MTFLDRIKETSTSTGTGTFTLGGAVLGYKVFTNGTYKYCIVNETESEWEVGEGTVASGVLTRTTIEASSNGGAAVSFSAGTKYVFNTVSAAYVNSLVPYTGATAAVNLGAYGLTSDYLQLSTTPTATGAVGRMLWNDTDGTMDIGLKGGNVTLQVGQEQVVRVVNKVGASLLEANYQAVYISGAQGQRPKVALAQANVDATSASTIGLVTETIADNQEGFITTSGIVRGINTTGSLQGETWADGDIVYLSPTTAGRITNVKPTAPNHTVVIGYVIYAHATQGKIFVKVDNGYEIGELHDVYAPSPATGNGLFWNATNSRYELNTIAGVLGYTAANDSLVVHLAGAENITGVKTFQNALQTTVGNNLLNTGGGNTAIGYTSDPASSATYKLDVNGGVKMYGVHLIQSNVAGGNTFLTISNQAGTDIATLTNAGALQFSGTANFTNTIGFNGKIGSSSTGGIAIVPGGVPSSLSTSQIMLLVSAPLGDYTGTYGLNEQGVFLGGTYNGGQGPQRLVLGPGAYYNNAGVATNVWNFTITPASGQVTDGYGSSLILASGRGRGAGIGGDLIFQTSTVTSSGTNLQTLSERLIIKYNTGNVAIGYASGSVPNVNKLEVNGAISTTILKPGTILFNNAANGKIVIDGGVNGATTAAGGTSTAPQSIFIGPYAGSDVSGSANNSMVCIGVGAGSGITTGGLGSILIGRNTGRGIITGVNNVIIGGTDATNLTSTMSYSLHLLPAGYEQNDAAKTLGSATASPHAFIGGGFNSSSYLNNFYFGAGAFVTVPSFANLNFYAPSGTGTDLVGASFTINAGRGTGTGTPGKFIVQTSTATTTGTTLQTLSNRLEVDGTGQLKLNGYTSTSVFTGTVAGLLGFDSSGNVITTSASGGGISGSGTAGQITYWSGTSAVTGSSNLVWDNTNGRLGIGTSSPLSLMHLKPSTSATSILVLENPVSTSGSAQSYIYSIGLNQTTSGANNATLTTFVAGPGSINHYDGPFFTMKGNNFIGYNGQKGSIRFYAGSITSPVGDDGNILFNSPSSFIDFATGNGVITKMRIFNGGNVTIQNGGTFTDGGQRLQVIGSMRVGTTAASAMYWDDTNARLIIGNTSGTARLDIGASTTSASALRIRSGTAPTSPNDGDIWYDGTNIYIRVGTTTKTFTIL